MTPVFFSWSADEIVIAEGGISIGFDSQSHECKGVGDVGDELDHSPLCISTSPTMSQVAHTS